MQFNLLTLLSHETYRTASYRMHLIKDELIILHFA